MSAQQRKATGLDRERPLPPGFSATTDMKAGKVEISREGTNRRVKVAMNSYASVANVLSGLWPDGDASLEPGSALVIEDGFSGRKATVVAAALPDVAAALKGLVTKPGKYVPGTESSKESAPAKESVTKEETRPAAKAAPAAKKAAVAKAQPSAARKAASTKKAAPASKAKGEPEAGAKQPAPQRTKGIPPMPEWLKAFKDREDTDDGRGGTMELERMPVGLGEGGYKEVLGRAKGGEPGIAWGYEVRVDGERVAWLLAKGQGFVIAGVRSFDYKPSEHRVFGGAVARLQAIIVPRHREARKQAV